MTRRKTVNVAGRRVRLFSDDDGKSWSSSPADLTAYRRRIEQALASGGDHKLHTAAHWRRQRGARRQAEGAR